MSEEIEKQLQELEKLEKQINFKFKDRKLLKTAFIHKSFLNECKNSNLDHNERLEFLGDAVLELITTEHLYSHYDKPEGVLTNWRSALVKGENLAEMARKLKLGEYLLLSRGEELGGGRNKNYLLANVFEALVGAIYLDQGYEPSKKFIHRFVIHYLEEIIDKGLHIDPKSLFQEISQEKTSFTPEYRVLEESGPDHQKIFTMGVFLNDELIGEGQGNNKQDGEQTAAQDALKNKKWG